MSEESRTIPTDHRRLGPDGAGRRRAVPTLLSAVTHWIKSAGVAFVLFLIIRAFLVEAFKIPTGSMENTLLTGDFLLVNKVLFGAEVPGTGLRLPALREPRREDVIVFNPPHDPERSYVKRLVGVPGDTLEMHGKVLHLNGVQVAEPYARYVDRFGDAVHPSMNWQAHHLIASTHRGYHPSRDNWGPLVVPEGRFFVLGDNRDNSEDSRYWGFVERSAIHGRPWFVYFSFDAAALAYAPWSAAVRWDRVGKTIR